MLQGVKNVNASSLLMAVLMCGYLSACNASPQATESKSATATPEVKADLTLTAEESASHPLSFSGTISGEPLDFNDGKGPDSAAVKKFKITGRNPYNDDKEVINRGYTIFSTACAGCHGHLAEGKLGPALADDYWTYPGNMTDKGIFETIYGGGQGMMGPQRGLLAQDEILQVMSWLRSIYVGDPKKAKWKKKE